MLLHMLRVGKAPKFLIITSQDSLVWNCLVIYVIYYSQLKSTLKWE